MEREFNPETAGKVQKIIFANEEFTSGAVGVVASPDPDLDEDIEMPTALALPGPMHAAPRRDVSIPSDLVESIPVPGGAVKLVFSVPPTKQTIDYLQKYLTLRISLFPDTSNNSN